MNQVWINIFKKWIDCNNSINTLDKNGILEDFDECYRLKEKLLNEIIETCKSEVGP